MGTFIFGKTVYNNNSGNINRNQFCLLAVPLNIQVNYKRFWWDGLSTIIGLSRGVLPCSNVGSKNLEAERRPYINCI